MSRKKKPFRLPKIDVPEKYQPYKGVSLDRHHPDWEEEIDE